MEVQTETRGRQAGRTSGRAGNRVQTGPLSMNNRITILLTLLFLMAPAMAAQGEYLLSEKTYRALSAAQELMEAERYTQAGQQLDTLLRSTESGSYDRAVVLQTIGYLHSAQGQYNR